MLAFNFFQEGQNCGFVQWVDEQWPPTMENALLKLWSMVEESKSARVNDNLQSALTIHHLTEEKKKLDADYDKLVKDVHQLVDFQQDRVWISVICSLLSHISTNAELNWWLV